MIYSVFDWRVGRYRYYSGPGEELGIRPKGVAINDDAGHHQLEAVLPRVPVSAQIVGEGDEPRGRIAVIDGDSATGVEAPASGGGSMISGFGATPGNPLSTSPWLTLGIWAAGVWAAFRLAEWIGKKAEKGL